MRVASWPVVGQRATAIGRFLNRHTPPQHRAVVFVPVGKLSWSLRCKPGHSIRVALDGVCLVVYVAVARVQHHSHAEHHSEQAAPVSGVKQVP